MHLYESLYSQTEWAQENDDLSFVVDLGDLGLREAYRAHEVLKSASCPLFRLAGPEIINPRTGKREVSGWIL